MSDDTPGIGHNSQVGGIAAKALAQYVSRIERLEDEKKAIAEDIKEVFSEAKSSGFDNKIIRMLLRRRRMEAAEREEQDQLLELYERALLQSLLE